MSEEKTVVASDIHMSDGKKYSWFRGKYPQCLEAMFRQIATDGSVTELMLLGDVFDTWLYPVNTVPFTFNQVVDTWDQSVIAALKLCIKNIQTVYYQNGNHDMWVTQENLNYISANGKTIQWISPDNYNKLYQGQRHLEHGNLVDMFNAPDNSGDTIGHYPFGYFITRLACSGDDPASLWQKIAEIIRKLFGKHELQACAELDLGELLIKTIVDALQLYSGLGDTTPILFGDDGPQNITIGTVKEKYHSLLSRWFVKYPSDIVNTALAGLLPNGLDWYADKLIASGAAPLVVMGHTHHGEDKIYPSPDSGQYDNDGCWCDTDGKCDGDGTVPTYVEIVGTKATLLRWDFTSGTFK